MTCRSWRPVLIAVLGVLGALACTAPRPEPARQAELPTQVPAPPPLPPPAASGPQQLTYGLASKPGTLDPAKPLTLGAEEIVWLLCDSLARRSRDGTQLLPAPAESWTESQDGRHVVVRLRAGTTFHDGTPVDAWAVQANLERQIRRAHPLYTRSPANVKEPALVELIEKIGVQDPSTLDLWLRYPDFPALATLELVSPRALATLGKGFEQQPVCSGPFIFQGQTPTDLRVVANPSYWAGRPKLDAVVFRFPVAPAAALEALRAGTVDVLPSISTETYERLKETPDIRVELVPALDVVYLGFRTDQPPFSDLALRQAVVRALDIPYMAHTFGRGLKLPAHGPLAPVMTRASPTPAQAGYDWQAATALVKQAATRSARPVTLAVHDVPLFRETGIAIQGALSRIGLQVEVVVKPYWPDVLALVQEGVADMFLSAWSVSQPQPALMLRSLFGRRNWLGRGLTRYSNPRVDALLDQARQVPEGPVRDGLYAEVQRQIIADAPMVFLYHGLHPSGYSARVRGLQLD